MYKNIQLTVSVLKLRSQDVLLFDQRVLLKEEISARWKRAIFLNFVLRYLIEFWVFIFIMQLNAAV
jgi:hypothetical protein